jgi:hypothetical protein
MSSAQATHLHKGQQGKWSLAAAAVSAPTHHTLLFP